MAFFFNPIIATLVKRFCRLLSLSILLRKFTIDEKEDFLSELP